MMELTKDNMLNARPIFVNGVARGGTNILMNILLSHPETAMPSGELQKVIRGGAYGDSRSDIIRKRFLYEFLLSLTLGNDYFLPRNTNKRELPPNWIQSHIDWMLQREKMKAIKQAPHNAFIDQSRRYTADALNNTRLVCKNISGLVYLTDVFRSMYADARFVCVVRNGLALLEGHLRRGKDCEKFTNFYHQIVKEMIRCRDHYENFLVVRYEDILKSPQGIMSSIYRFVDLDLDKVNRVRFQLKSTVQEDGTALELGEEDRALRWYSIEEMDRHFKFDANENQIAKLSASQVDTFMKRNGEFMEKLGYCD